MRHYEIVFLVHPDQSDQTQSVLNKFSSIVNESGGKVHRLENIGRRKLVYPIEDQFKASYALLNVECNKDALDEIKSSFKFNDSIIRDLIISKNNAETGLSALSSQTEQEENEHFSDKEELKQPQLKSLDEQPKGLKETKENENIESSQEELQVTKE
ncbi:MAG: 30S ribosomal protein S6 [Pseudomonadota bacterium]|nr:30S ribosomal protein S6 [Pseudomonadota bacterium]